MTALPPALSALVVVLCFGCTLVVSELSYDPDDTESDEGVTMRDARVVDAAEMDAADGSPTADSSSPDVSLDTGDSEEDPTPCFPEVCDGSDNDCDGRIDEDPVGPCITGDGDCARAGIRTCVDGTETCTAPPLEVDEICNEQDDDCDGMIDEGVDVSADPLHCGACGQACGMGEFCADALCRSHLVYTGAAPMGDPCLINTFEASAEALIEGVEACGADVDDLVTIGCHQRGNDQWLLATGFQATILRTPGVEDFAVGGEVNWFLQLDVSFGFTDGNPEDRARRCGIPDVMAPARTFCLSLSGTAPGGRGFCQDTVISGEDGNRWAWAVWVERTGGGSD